MKKKTIITISVIFLLFLVFTIFTIYLNFVFSPDDYGEKYEKVWSSKDGNITFILDNKKGFYGPNNEYRCNYLNNNSDYSRECTIAFSPFFNMYISGSEILSGESYYNPITQTIKVTIDYINTDSIFKTSYKVGDVIEFKQSE